MRGEVAKRGGGDAGTSTTTRDKEIARNPHPTEGLGRDGPISLLILLADVARLLIGELGDAANDPPVKALVVDDLLSDGMTGGPVNFRGTETDVIPLETGPTLVLAEVVHEDEWSKPGRGSNCPAGTQQVVRATWTGGVRLPNGDTAGDAERALYRVTVERPDGSREEITPAVLADLGDRDNNHRLCLGTTDSAVSVAFPAGYLVDPNQDRNPDTRGAVTTVPRTAPH